VRPSEGHGDSGAGLWPAEALWGACQRRQVAGLCLFFFLTTAAGDAGFVLFCFLSLFCCCCFKVTSSLAFKKCLFIFN
jgi:hypothetical protein